MASQHVNIVVGTVGSEGRYMYTCSYLPPTSYEEVVCGDETDAQTNTV